jgi:membrane associated rhomboid family serine protease
VVFGSIVARRFGPWRFLLFSAATAIAGALAQLALHPDEFVVMVGASASVSGYMAAAMRFALTAPFGAQEESDDEPAKAAPLRLALRNPRVLAFLIVWLAINIIAGTGTAPIADADDSVAWEAHLGGFLLGLFAFSAFDPVARTRAQPG